MMERREHHMKGRRRLARHRLGEHHRWVEHKRRGRHRWVQVEEQEFSLDLEEP